MYVCKAHIGVYGNEIADKVTKEAAQNTAARYEYKRIPKRHLYHVEAGQTKMADRMDNMQQGGCNKTIFSICTGQTREQN